MVYLLLDSILSKSRDQCGPNTVNLGGNTQQCSSQRTSRQTVQKWLKSDQNILVVTKSEHNVNSTRKVMINSVWAFQRQYTCIQPHNDILNIDM